MENEKNRDINELQSKPPEEGANDTEIFPKGASDTEIAQRLIGLIDNATNAESYPGEAAELQKLYVGELEKFLQKVTNDQVKRYIEIKIDEYYKKNNKNNERAE